MKILLLVFLVMDVSWAASVFNESDFVKDSITKDLEEFSLSYFNKRIKITEAKTRISINPLQWLLMLKDLAASEKRKVMIFKYKEDEANNLKKGYTIFTYSKLIENDEVCFQIALNKLEMDISWVNISGLVPGIKNLRVIERCISKSYSF
ncbi:MAG: hypothetical protein CME65_04125 [Halobacteriovoraceae bacterium]|nr:hypothetical protein [Halobacteriovoraceae bacterium]|tara:strand:+ start:24363 stop:24812 length:450 start_codon:yes stop_codon:yes gene_type:complete